MNTLSVDEKSFESVKKKLRIKKYPNTCERGLNHVTLVVFSIFFSRFFQPVGAALLDTLDKGLGEKFTSQVKEAWTVVYGIVADTMKVGLKEVLEG